MFQVQTHLFGTSLESIFPRAVPFTKAGLDRLGEALLDAFAPQGLSSEHLSLRKGDELFDYELKFRMFRGDAEFSLDARRLKMHFANATQPGDLETITVTAVRCLACLTPPEGTSHQLSTFAHFTFGSPEDFQSCFSTQGTRWAADFPQLGITAILAEPGWPETIRATLEPSLLIQPGGFLMLTTSLATVVVDAERLLEVERALQRSTARLQLQFKSAE